MSYLDKTNIRPSTRLGNENCNMEYKICIIGTFYENLLNIYRDFIMATRVFPSMSENFALLVIRHLMCQMVKTAEEADAACEFITNLANNLKPKLIALDRVIRRAVQDADRILTQEGTSLAIVHRKKKKKHLCLTTKLGKTSMALFYEAWNSVEGSIYTSPSFNTVLNEIELSFENLFPQFYKYLFNSSNITISYEAYSFL
ncbi:hypothetical protein V1477_001461 [Vespula maculifrons]|uniref:Uncharacterized protein n=1 Tax=Vespula maculifrons TaxID=7453 RepID=A0ABD2CYY9_VESMC